MQKNNIRIKKHFSQIIHDENTVELRSGVWNPYSHTIHDEDKNGNLFKIISFLDGSFSVSEICKSLSISRAEVESVIDHLQRLGVLETNASTAFQHYIDTVSPMTAQVDSSISTPHWPVLLIGDIHLTKQVYEFLNPVLSQDKLRILDLKDDLYTELSNPNDQWLHDGLLLTEKLEKFKVWSNHFIIILQHPVNPILASGFNRIAHHLKISWLYAAIDGPFLFVGPTVVPHRGACFDCFETRITMNLRETTSYQNYKKFLVSGKVYHSKNPEINPSLAGLLSSHVSMEALNFIFTQSSFTRNKVLSIYLPTMEIVFNDVFRVSGCPTCDSKPQRDDVEHYFDARALLGEELV